MMKLAELIQSARLAWRLVNDRRVPAWVRLGIPVIVAIYVISPIDFIPDFIPVVGELDDMGVVLLGLSLMARFSPAYVVEEHRQALGYSSGQRSGAGGSAQPGGSGGYWGMPPANDGSSRKRTPSAEQPIDGEYKVIPPEK